ncbi:hypothetical protein PPACK8108_LOCUS81 [Phakopsora pachyrhizi]|uniref:Uncharacterized protein n=1 Tax=Phakopsora pachyrhizi TaxID=170000 RepID=A0AAV0ACR5_PHAPC|nr:hypothetical protein PPACK8108_LOCUS81 [Phakopsora pachyrhizi]
MGSVQMCPIAYKRGHEKLCISNPSEARPEREELYWNKTEIFEAEYLWFAKPMSDQIHNINLICRFLDLTTIDRGCRQTEKDHKDTIGENRRIEDEDKHCVIGLARGEKKQDDRETEVPIVKGDKDDGYDTYQPSRVDWVNESIGQFPRAVSWTELCSRRLWMEFGGDWRYQKLLME